MIKDKNSQHHLQKEMINPTHHRKNKKPHECGNNYKCNFIPIWLSLNPNAL